VHWQDEAIILATSRFSESSLRLDLLTATHGRYAGIVRGGASSKRRASFDIGNIIQATWRARLSEQLGSFTTELLSQPTATALGDPLALNTLNAATALLLQKLPERHAEPAIYDSFKSLLLHLVDGRSSYVPLYVAFEITLLSACGFPLDLSSCAATGSTEDLIYVSPKSGRAVSREAGAPYAEKLLKLPAFLHMRAGNGYTPSHEDILEALTLTGFFLNHHANEITHKPLPQSRQRLLDRLA
jgi:DNA repair protein RecO (recombination protein O)